MNNKYNYKTLYYYLEVDDTVLRYILSYTRK
jgi:hypothetical protein